MAYFSTKSSDYQGAITALKKPTYESQYGSTISSIMDKIANKESFSYDFNADPLYQNFKDQYTKLGNEASMNAVANTSAMTGGFANSYSATAASQANQQYLTELNSVIPELYNAALSKYQMETEDLYNQFGMYETEENRLYGQYRDNVSDYYSDLSDLRNGYSTALSNEQWEKDYALSLAAYQSGLDQWTQNFNYQKERDAVSDAQWQAQYELSKSKSGGTGVTGYTPLSDSQYYSLAKSNGSTSTAKAATKSGSNYKNVLNDINSMSSKAQKTDYIKQQWANGNLTQSEYQTLYNKIRG